MQLKKLDTSFYNDHTSLVNALDFHYPGGWQKDKVRGYGIVIISINNLTFGIPLHSHIKHSAGYIAVASSIPREGGAGLDFSKALLLSKPSYITPYDFKINPDTHLKLKAKARYIHAKFEKYVLRYIHAARTEDRNILSSKEYRYSTLVNYHTELGV